MLTKITPLCAVLVALCAYPRLIAQTLPGTQTTTSATSENSTMLDAVKFRADMAAAVVSKSETPEAALVRLKSRTSPTGLKLNQDGDFALAAIDVGHRLFAVGKATEAVKFFLEAEKALDAVVKKTPDSAVNDKTQYLKALAFIRGRFLGKVDQAKADLEQAIKLNPNDKGLNAAREQLAKDKAEIFKDKPKG